MSALRVKIVKNTEDVPSLRMNKRELATEALRVNIVKDDRPPELADEEEKE